MQKKPIQIAILAVLLFVLSIVATTFFTLPKEAPSVDPPATPVISTAEPVTAPDTIPAPPVDVTSNVGGSKAGGSKAGGSKVGGPKKSGSGYYADQDNEPRR